MQFAWHCIDGARCTAYDIHVARMFSIIRQQPFANSLQIANAAVISCITKTRWIQQCWRHTFINRFADTVFRSQLIIRYACSFQHSESTNKRIVSQKYPLGLLQRWVPALIAFLMRVLRRCSYKLKNWNGASLHLTPELCLRLLVNWEKIQLYHYKIYWRCRGDNKIMDTRLIPGGKQFE